MSVTRMSALLICLVMLSACAARVLKAATPVNVPTVTIEASSTDRVELAAGHYQLLMLYSPL